MLAVASLLDQEHSDKVNQIVTQLDSIFGLKGVQLTPYPHLTWLTTDVAKMSDLKDYLRKISEESHPFTARTMGIGIFPGEIFSADAKHRGFVRVSCGAPWSPVIERAIATLGRLCRELKGSPRG